MNRDRDLWNEYRRTWKAFAACLDRWQRAEESEKTQLHEALEAARAAHKEARDRLAVRLTSRDEPAPDTARLRWEFGVAQPR